MTKCRLLIIHINNSYQCECSNKNIVEMFILLLFPSNVEVQVLLGQSLNSIWFIVKIVEIKLIKCLLFHVDIQFSIVLDAIIKYFILLNVLNSFP